MPAFSQDDVLSSIVDRITLLRNVLTSEVQSVLFPFDDSLCKPLLEVNNS